ncbi:MAG: hypothetical protein WEB06_03305 [Actinomycetota bacterium]
MRTQGGFASATARDTSTTRRGLRAATITLAAAAMLLPMTVVVEAAAPCPAGLTPETSRPIPVRTSATNFSVRVHSVSPVTSPWDIVTGPDGNLWVSGSSSRIARVTTSGTATTFDMRVRELVLSPGSDGNIWYGAANQFGRVKPATGKVTARFGFVGNPNDMTLGPDGNIWYANNPSEFGLPGTDAVGRISPTGQIDHFGPVSYAPFFVSPGPDGNIWFTSKNGGGILGCVTPFGEITEYDPPGFGAPEGITKGPDGAIWITERGADRIARVTPAGSYRAYALPQEFEEPIAIEAGADGNLYFTLFGCFCPEILTNVVGRLTPDGILTEFMLPDQLNPLAVVAGPDEKMWFTAPATASVFVLEDFEPCTITGTDRDDLLIGTPGRDVICGRAGDDVIDGLGGDDVLIGGIGSDTVDYSSSPSAVTVDIGSQTAAGNGNDQIPSMENVIGSAFGDSIVGTARSRSLSGGAGDDQILSPGFGSTAVYGGAGNDTLEGGGSLFSGGDGNDILFGSPQFMDGGNGDDILKIFSEIGCAPSGGCRAAEQLIGEAMITGGPGHDAYDASNIGVGLSVDLATGEVFACLSEPEPGFCEMAISFGIGEIEVVIGTAFDDVITGDDLNNHLLGEAGDDTLDGRGGVDTLDGGLGTDQCTNGETVSGCET